MATTAILTENFGKHSIKGLCEFPATLPALTVRVSIDVDTAPRRVRIQVNRLSSSADEGFLGLKQGFWDALRFGMMGIVQRCLKGRRCLS